MNKRLLSLLLALLMLVSLLPTAALAAVGDGELPAEAPAAAEDAAVPAETPADPAGDAAQATPAAVTNIALGKTVTASQTDSNFPTEKAVDGDDTTSTSYWATSWGSTTLPAWLQIDLGAGATATVDNMVIKFRSDQYSNDYTIATSATAADNSWTTIYTLSGRTGAAANQTDTISYTDGSSGLTQNTLKRYVRITFTSLNNTNAVSVFEWKINGELVGGSSDPTGTPDGNLCRPLDCEPADTATTVTATASSQEADSVRPALAIDGNNSSSSSRWGSQIGDSSASNPHWLQIDLGTTRRVSYVKIYWERLNVLAYTLQGSADGTSWSTLYNCSSEITTVNEAITFDPVNIRYLKLNITSHKSTGLKGDGSESVNWNTVSLFEVEVYRDQAASQLPSPAEIAQSTTFKVENGKLVPDYVRPGYTVESYAANLEQVVGEDGTIYTPVVDKVVSLDVTLKRTATNTTISTAADTPIRVTIPGAHTDAENANGNPKPAVIPEIMEWYSHGTNAGYKGQSYTFPAGGVRIRYRQPFQDVANALVQDLQDLFGITVTKAPLTGSFSTLQDPGVLEDGDIVLFDVQPGTAGEDTRQRVQGYDDETYGMEIYGGKVYIYATHATGAYWGTRTLLQGLKLGQADNGTPSFPNGTLRDYPEFKLRGFIMDVGRKPMSMDLLRNVVKNMAWYKLNDFHVHLSDNLIFMEDYGVTANNYTNPSDYAKANDAYSAFRLESSLQEAPNAIAPLSAKDYHYTKNEFKSFIADSAALGVNIVPEIDVPAHAKPITDAFPDLRLQGVWGGQWGYAHPANCHLDLNNKYDQSLAKVQEIFDDYMDEDDPVFTGPVVDFGADEYFGGGTAFRKFMKDMIAYVKEKGYTPRLWGSISHGMIASTDETLQFDDKEANKGVQMNIWNTGFANPQAMFDKGFSLINVTDGPFYMVPSGGGGRGGYGDYLNLTDIYAKAPNQIGSTWLPASSEQVLGSAFAIWDDSMIDTHSSGLDEMDVFDRFYDALPVTAVRQWGVVNNTPARTLAELQEDIAKIGLAPNSDPYYEVAAEDHFSYDFADATDKTNDHDLTLTNAAIDPVRHLLMLNGSESYAETGLDRLGRGNQLTFKVFKLQGGGEEQVIFEGDHLSADSTFAYNELAIKALPVEDDDTVWRLGFSRELHDYEFPVDLPVGEWVKLTLTNSKQSTKLSVDGGAPVAAVGKLVSDENSNTPFKGTTGITNSSFAFPVTRIGSKTNALVGYVAAVSSGTVADAFLTASAPSEANNGSDGPASNVVDGKTNTYWHSNYNNSSGNPVGNGPVTLTDETRYIEIQLAQPATVAGLRHLCRQSGGNNGKITAADIKVSTNTTVTEGSDAGFTTVASGTNWSATANTYDKVTFTPHENVRYVRIYGTTTTGGFMSAAEIELIYGPLTDSSVDVTLGDVSWNAAQTAATVDLTVTLKPSGLVLVEGTDYTMAYSNNTAPGTGTVTITGKGDYSGSVSKTFTVPAKPTLVSLADAVITFPQESYPLENGKAEPVPTVKVGQTNLLMGLDYTAVYAHNTRPGTATITITGIGNYEGEASAEFTVTGAIVKVDISQATVTLPQANFTYTGERITPEPHVVLNGEELRKDTDYTVSYGTNTNIGTGSVTVTGKAPYFEGTQTVQFRIVDPNDVNDLSNREKTTVTFAQSSYELTNGKAEPEPVVRYEGKRLVKDRDYTISYLNNTGGGTGVAIVQGIGDYIGRYAATFTINGAGTGTGEGGGGGGGTGGGGTGGSSVVASTSGKQADGATVKKTTDATGVITTQATYPGGSKVAGTIGVDGLVTAVVTVPKSAGSATVTIPTREAPKPGQVAVILHPDGTEEIIKTALLAEDGIQVTLKEDTLLQIVDNAKTFVDVPANSWAKDAIDFVTSREIFNGTGNRTFSPSSDMSRAMVCTVLANLAGEETKGGATWYEKALTWAKSEGISDGTIPDAIITREQLAVMLYRYADSPVVTDEVPRRFRDRDDVADWAELAVTWAVQNDLLRGRSSLDGLDLAPKSTATRAEVASVLQRYVALLQ